MIVFWMIALVYLNDSGLQQVHMRYFTLIIMASFIIDLAWLAIFTNVTKKFNQYSHVFHEGLVLFL